MAILHRNPMPLSGALFVTNPRRKKKSSLHINPLMRKNARRKAAPVDSKQMPLFEELNSLVGGKTSAPKRKKSAKPVSAKKTVKVVSAKKSVKKSAKKSVTKVSSRKVLSVATKSKKASAALVQWRAFQKKMGGVGLKRSEMADLFKKKKSATDLRKLKSEIKKQARKMNDQRLGRRLIRKAKQQVKVDMPTLFNPMKKVGLRRNPILGVNLLATPIALVQAVQARLQTMPVVNMVAWAVTPIALGYGTLKIHQVVRPYVTGKLIPAVQKGVANIPVVNTLAAPVLTKAVAYPYTSTAIVSGLALGFLAQRGYVSRQAAALVASTAATVGFVLDSVTKEETAEMGAIAYGDGGQYMIGRDSSALGAIDMNGFGAVQLGAVQMAGIADSEYGDASVADAKACTCQMMPDEVAAAKAGKAAYIRKFGQSPKNLRTSQSLMSRHAGRPGHRYGWIVKMLGFENFQQIASLPPKQREIVISQLQQQAIAAIPKLVAQQQAQGASIESAAIPVHGTLNGVGGAEGVAYGALMFAGNGY